MPSTTYSNGLPNVELGPCETKASKPHTSGNGGIYNFHRNHWSIIRGNPLGLSFKERAFSHLGFAYWKNILSCPGVRVKACAARLSERPTGRCQWDKPSGPLWNSFILKANKMPSSLHFPGPAVFRRHDSNEHRTQLPLLSHFTLNAKEIWYQSFGIMNWKMVTRRVRAQSNLGHWMSPNNVKIGHAGYRHGAFFFNRYIFLIGV